MTQVEMVVSSYNALQTELSTKHQAVTVSEFLGILRLTTEVVVFVFDQGVLIATAQASLTFPGCRPRVTIGNVVVADGYRGQGIGRCLMHETERLITSRFADVLPLTIMLTSKRERGTEPFYTSMGYRSDSTLRYQKVVTASAS
jgi:GNAT superfamily N-acetyltransferase